MTTPPLAPSESASRGSQASGDCPTCGTSTLPGQEYCLECGSRLPGYGTGGPEGPGRRSSREGWLWPALVTFVVAALATAGVLALRAAGDDEKALLVATGEQGTEVTATVAVPTLAPTPEPTAPTQTPPPRTGPPPTATTGRPRPAPTGLAQWPAGRTGYTVVLVSLAERGGRAEAVGKARAAREAGLPQVGVLRSSRFSSLHPGYYVVFSGIYATMAEAARTVSRARSAGYETAYARLIAS